MNEELQAQLAAMRAEYEQLIVNISHQCADKAMVIAALTSRIKALAAEIEAMKPKPETSPS